MIAEMKSFQIRQLPRKLFIFLALGLFIRLILTVQTPFSDAPAFRFWALYLQDNSLVGLFRDLPGGYTPYPPLYYYLLMPLGFLVSVFRVEQFWWMSELILRLPYYLADIASSVFIFTITRDLFGRKKAFTSTIFFLFHPALIITGTLWGQFDSIILFLSLLVVWSLVRKRYEVVWTTFLIGALTKLQIIPLAPLIGILSFSKWKKFLKLTPLFFIGIVLVFLPVISEQGISWTFSYFRALPHWYPYTSVYATNFWSLFGFLIRDSFLVFGVPLKLLSIAIVGSFALFIVYPFFKREQKNKAVYWAALLLFFTFSFWSTRVHSRYFVYMLPFLSIFATQNIVLSIVLSLIMIVNVLLPATDIGIDGLVGFLNQKNTILVFVVAGLGGYIWMLQKYVKTLQEKTK